MKAWDSDALLDVEQAMAERLEGLLEPGEHLSAWGESSTGEVQARFRLQGSSDGAKLELRARVDLGRAALDEPAARELVLDALDLCLLEYLESGRRQRLAGVFEERELRGKPVSVCAERTFPSLDARADAVLEGLAERRSGVGRAADERVEEEQHDRSRDGEDEPSC